MKNKFGFTMPELVVTISIISVLIVVSLYAVSHHFTDFYSRYYAAYDSLNKVAYNTYTDTHCRSNAGFADCKITTENGVQNATEVNEGRPFPEYPKQLCERFIEYYNVTSANCQGDKGDEELHIIKNANNSEFNENTLQFSTTNGFKYYFSKLNEIKFGTPEVTVNYFIVYIDLNGKGEPNKVDHPIHPDIVPFAVTTTGDVIPIGHPIYDKSYASVRVINYDGKQSSSFTFDEARQIAFGNGVPFVDMPITLMRELDDKLPGPAKRNSMRTTKTISDYDFIDPDTSAEQKFACQEGTFNCTVKIDENMEKRY